MVMVASLEQSWKAPLSIKTTVLSNETSFMDVKPLKLLLTLWHLKETKVKPSHPSKALLSISFKPSPKVKEDKLRQP